MTKLEKQLKDWEKLKKLCDKVKILQGEARKEIVEELYTEIKSYFDIYKTKFDYGNPPE